MFKFKSSNFLKQHFKGRRRIIKRFRYFLDTKTHKSVAHLVELFNGSAFNIGLITGNSDEIDVKSGAINSSTRWANTSTDLLFKLT